jgi:hypothetical protein
LGSLTREAALREAFGPQFKKEETAKEFIRRLETENGIVTGDEQPSDRAYDWFIEGITPTKDWWKMAHEEAAKADETPAPSGGSNAYYKLPEGAKELGDLIEFKNMNFNVGNIFKAAYRLGEKAGNTKVYDLEKIIWFAKRELARERKKVAL